MSQNLYLIFYKTYDNLCVLSANFYNDVDEGILDFHRIYVFLNYQIFLDPYYSTTFFNSSSVNSLNSPNSKSSGKKKFPIPIL